jgi:WD40 repeat protein
VLVRPFPAIARSHPPPLPPLALPRRCHTGDVWDAARTNDTTLLRCRSMHDPKVLATTSGEKDIKVWDIERSQVLFEVNTGKYLPKVLAWNPHDPHSLAVVSKAGHVFVYDYRSSGKPTYAYEHLNALTFRWHPNRAKAGHWAAGTFQGDLLVGSLGGGRPQKFSIDSLGKKDLGEMQWDPLSETYILLANSLGTVVLFDVSTGMEMTVFDRAAGGLSGIAFVPGEPGNFVTAGEKTGILRLWNVSQKTPKGVCRPSKSGFQNLIFAPGERGQNGAATVCSFNDGSCGVYDLRKKGWDFLTEEAHTETIFDCVFKPNNPDHLATVSYDGFVKLWDLATMTCIGTVGGNDGVLYCASWSPSDDRILTSSSNGKIFVMECVPGRGKVVFGLQVHAEGKPSFRCAWNPVTPDYVVSTSSDCFACVVNVSAQAVVQRYKHPQAVFGCDWHKTNGNIFATGCQDSIVRVFDRAQDGILYSLQAHTEKVFNVAWSTLLPDMLMSGSDDRNVHIWDTTKPSQSAACLRGHTQNVRALNWHSEIPWMVVTGSWDSTIRVWDFRDGRCLRVVTDHHADVYGLGSHPKRPFLFASSSRDNTIRQWRLDDIVSQMPVSSLVIGHPAEKFGELLGSVSEAMAGPTLLAGQASQAVAAQLDRCPDECSRMKLVSCFLGSPPDLAELWNLAHTILSGKIMTVRNRIVHADDVLRTMQARAQELEGARVAKFTGIGGARKEDQLEHAAKLYLRLGMIQQHCEILVELGHWERALSVAPGAGMGYWSSLSLRYADHLEELKKYEEAVPYLAATHSVDRLVRSVVSHGKLEDAFVVSKAACAGRFNRLQLEDSGPGVSREEEEEAMARLHNVSRMLGQRHIALGRPILGAACRLAVNDTEMAVRALYLGNELTLAAELAGTFGQQDETSDAIYAALSLSLEANQSWDLAAGVLRKQRPEQSQLSLMLLAARYDGLGQEAELDQGAEIERFYQHCGLDPPSAIAARASSAANTAEELICHAAGRDSIRAAMIGCGELRRILSAPGWAVDDAEALSRPLQSLDVEGLQDDDVKSMVIFYTAYVGSAAACVRGMVSVASGLVRHASRRVRHRDLSSKLPDGINVEVLDQLAECYAEGDTTLTRYRQHALAPSAANMEAT